MKVMDIPIVNDALESTPETIRNRRTNSDNLKYSIIEIGQNTEKSPRGVMVKEMDFGIVVCEFVLQSCYYTHFRANTLGRGMNSLILRAMG